MNENWIYIGIFLDASSRRKLMKLYPKPEGWNQYYDHMTVVFNDDSDVAKAVKSINEHNIGKKFKLKLVGPGISKKAYAVKVELPKGVVSANMITHITLATCPGNDGTAVDSNYITNWSKVYDNIYLTGEMKVFEPSKVLLTGERVEEVNVY
jgi:hypothetical protein